MCCPALLRACGNHSGEAERSYGIGLKLFGFIPEPVFTFIPESCSGSTRIAVRNHPGIAFILPRIPQLTGQSDSFQQLTVSRVFPQRFELREHVHRGKAIMPCIKRLI